MKLHKVQLLPNQTPFIAVLRLYTDESRFVQVNAHKKSVRAAPILRQYTLLLFKHVLRPDEYDDEDVGNVTKVLEEWSQT